MGTIIENIRNGTAIESLPREVIIEKISTAMKAYSFFGYDYEFFTKDNLEKLAGYLRNHHPKITDMELTHIISDGLSGEYGKNPREIKGYTIIGWIKEYMRKRDEVMLRQQHNSIFDSNITGGLSKNSMGSAILLKMDYVPTKDWEKIDTGKLAEIIDEEGRDAALEYCAQFTTITPRAF